MLASLFVAVATGGLVGLVDRLQAQDSTAVEDSDAASPQEEPGATSPALAYLSSTPRLFDDPWGARSWLEERGLTLSAYFNHQYGVNARGGKNTSGAQRHSGSLDYFVQLDTTRAGLWRDGELFLQAKTNYNTNINPDVGALSNPIDDADFDEALYVDQLWYQQSFLAGRVQTRAGYLDLQTIIDRNAFANSEDTQFMTTFLDNNNATIPLKIGMGVALWLRLTDWFQLIAGASDADNEILRAGFDTAFDDLDSLLVYGEGGLRMQWPSSRGPLTGNYRLGVFYDPRLKEVFGRSAPGSGAPELDRGDVGAYLSFDQVVWRESDQDEQGLGIFSRYGHGDEDVNRIAHFWSAGFQYLGLLPHRDTDALGLGVYQAIVSSRLRERVDRDFSRETGIETYYRIQWTRWLAVSPGFQFIDDPGGRSSARDTHVFVLRLRMAF